MSASKGRRYNQWSGNPNGWPEDKSRCVEEVWSNFLSYQCQRKRGFGPNGEYCKQHAKKHELSPSSNKEETEK